MNGAHFEQAVFQQLADAQALRAGEGEVELACDAALEQVQVLGAADAGHDHVQVVQALRVGLGQRTREKVGLLLVVALEHHAVAGGDQQFEGFDDPLGGQHHTVGQVTDAVQAALLLGAPPGPLRRWILGYGHQVTPRVRCRGGTVGRGWSGDQSSWGDDRYGWSNGLRFEVPGDGFSVVSRPSAARAAHRGQARSHICFGPVTPVKPTGTALLAW